MEGNSVKLKKGAEISSVSKENENSVTIKAKCQC